MATARRWAAHRSVDIGDVDSIVDNRADNPKERGAVMANSLLDFVLSLGRDPSAAARYAADPAKAISDADLTNVTSVDVQNLIPVVSESLSMATPSYGLDTVGADSATNVWTSGAAAAAFDTFSDDVPESVVLDSPSVVTDIVDQDGPGTDDLLEPLELELPEAVHLDDSAGAGAVVSDPGLAAAGIPPLPDPDVQPPGFDIFD